MPKKTETLQDKRMLELDVLRGFAMLVVVSSHISSVAIGNLRAGRGHFLVSMLQSSFNFSVPVFFLVGALLSAYSASAKNPPIWPYYKKKLLRLVLPYLAWTLFYIAFNLFVHRIGRADLRSFDNWVKWITQGRAYDHLYYLVVIFQFHLLFPLLLKLAKLVRDRPFWAFAIVVGGHHVVYWLNKLWLYKAWPYFSSSFFWHFSIFFLGLYIGLNYKKVCEWLERNLKWLIIVCLVSAAGFLYLRYLLYMKINYHTYFYYTIRLVYVTSLPLCLLAVARRLRDTLKRGIRHGQAFLFARKWAGRALLWIGRYSLGIYLAHPVLNHYLREWFKTRNVILLGLICAVAVVVYIAVCGVMTMVLERFRLTSWIVGAKASGGKKKRSGA
ncbi:MAG: acyltransferase [Oscillospiraceae bacterium]|nr:acyltransferase [Oscillospiraceae bacterium]